MSPTDALIARISEQRRQIDGAVAQRSGIQIRALVEGGTITDVKVSVKTYEGRGR
jgi:hypothetical protein